MTRLERIGIPLNAPPRVAAMKPAPRTARRPLLSQLPQSNILQCSWGAVTAVGVVGSGDAAWYGLARWKCPDDIGQVAVWSGYRVELGPTNPSGGAGVATPARVWGNTLATGAGAVIVIGRNLPFGTRAVWQPGPTAPFIDPADGVFTKRSPDQNLYFPFPPGDFGTDYTTSVRINQTTPYGAILADGTLDIALVIDRTYLSASGFFNGYCHIELLLGTDQVRGEISE